MIREVRKVAECQYKERNLYALSSGFQFFLYLRHIFCKVTSFYSFSREPPIVVLSRTIVLIVFFLSLYSNGVISFTKVHLERKKEQVKSL